MDKQKEVNKCVSIRDALKSTCTDIGNPSSSDEYEEHDSCAKMVRKAYRECIFKIFEAKDN